MICIEIQDPRLGFPVTDQVSGADTSSNIAKVNVTGGRGGANIHSEPLCAGV